MERRARAHQEPCVSHNLLIRPEAEVEMTEAPKMRTLRWGWGVMGGRLSVIPFVCRDGTTEVLQTCRTRFPYSGACVLQSVRGTQAL